MKSIRLEQLIADWVEAAPGSPERERLEADLAAYPNWRQTAEAHARLSGLLSAAPAPALRRSVAREVVSAIPAPPHAKHPVWFYWAGVGAAATAVVLALVLLVDTGPAPDLPRPGSGVHHLAATPPMTAEPMSFEVVAREHARVASRYAVADKAAWTVTLVEGNREVMR